MADLPPWAAAIGLPVSGSQIGAPNGVARLDSSAVVPVAEIPAVVVRQPALDSLANDAVRLAPVGTQRITKTAGVALEVAGGGSGNPVARWLDQALARSLVSVSNISGAGYAGSTNYFATNGIGNADATGAKLAWQTAVDQSAPTPDRDFVPAVKVRATLAAAVVTTGGSASVNAPAGTFDLLNDAGLFIASANIPLQVLASVQSDTAATLTTGAGVTAGTADATIQGARDIIYLFHNGKAPTKVGLLPRAYVGAALPSQASVHIGGPYANANDPQQLELLPGPAQDTAGGPAFGVRVLGDAQPVFTIASGGITGRLPGTVMAGPGGATAPDIQWGRDTPGGSAAFVTARTAAGIAGLLMASNRQAAAAGVGASMLFGVGGTTVGKIEVSMKDVNATTVGLFTSNSGVPIERMRFDNNGLAFNGSTPFFPAAAAAAATSPAAATATSPNAQTAAYVQADVTSLKTAIDALIADVASLRTSATSSAVLSTNIRVTTRALGLQT